MSEELKPCPCCGSSDLILELAVNDRIWVQCTDCTMRGWAEDWDNRADHVPDTSKMMWASVDDRLPDEDGFYIVFYLRPMEAFYSVQASQWTKRGVDGVKGLEPVPTHWMPLPEPPVQNES